MKLLKLLRVGVLVLIGGASFLLFTGCCSTWCESGSRQVIGETAYIRVGEIGEVLEARIDTGARTTSIHALNLVIEDDAQDFDANVGKVIHYSVVDAEGREFPLESVIGGVTLVRNAQGVERRYYVPMTLSWNGVEKPINVNLRDRSAMTYKLLIGRDWLAEDFLVNVDVADDEPENSLDLRD